MVEIRKRTRDDLNESACPGGIEGIAKTKAEMVRDPVCGTWIDRGIALTLRKEGQEVAVCSEECRKALEHAG